ncbi:MULTISPECIES: dsDNA nuclease domain-containing protein [unclassified Knoellia]|uniref:dsDNA nuclease domain-containing protein n=1 Tax=Knoellia altitudinis TaxID=3404795 RepID=UPI0036199443
MTGGGSADAGGQEALFDAAPVDDSGAETQDRFSWQHHCIAADAIRMLVGGGVVRIVCEVHQDYVIEDGAGFVLVSCKHREASRGPFTLSELCLEGGVAQLFARWQELGDVRLKLVTNAGLVAGKGESAELVAACAAIAGGASIDEDETRRRAREAFACALLAAGRRKQFTGIPVTPKPKKRSDPVEIPEGFIAKVEAFMRVFTLKPEMPPRQMIHTIHVHTVMQPALIEVGLAHLDATEAYDSLLATIADRNRMDGLSGRYQYWFWGDQLEGQRGTQAALVLARTISADDVQRACSATRTKHSGVLLRALESDHTKLEAKLLAGRVGPVRRREAERLREAWLAFRLERRSGLPGDSDEQYDLETRILGIAGDAESAAITAAGDVWGDLLFSELKERLRAASEGLAVGVSAELLLGAAFELTSRCHIWFSEEFDVNAALADVQQVGAQ